jgi:hypothetical protein
VCLDKVGIQGLVTPETEPDAAVACFLSGTLTLGQARRMRDRASIATAGMDAVVDWRVSH